MKKVNDAAARLHIALFTFITPLLVRLFPLRILLRLVTPPSGITPYRKMPPERIVAAVKRRLAAPRMMRRRACLREGLTAFHFLSLAGYSPELRFCVYPPDPSQRHMHAHCWVVLDGNPLTSPPQQAHAEMMRYSRAGGLVKVESREAGTDNG